MTIIVLWIGSRSSYSARHNSICGTCLCFWRRAAKLQPLYPQVDDMYNQVIRTCYRYPLGLIFPTLGFLSIRETEEFLELDSETIRSALRGLQSTIRVPVDDNEVIQPYHPDFVEFLQTQARYTIIPLAEGSALLSFCCFKVLIAKWNKEAVERNPLALQSGDSCTQYMGHALSYASYWWIAHFAGVMNENTSFPDLLKLRFSRFVDVSLSYWAKPLCLVGDAELAYHILGLTLVLVSCLLGLHLACYLIHFLV
jgi:hypothetical protein